MQNNVPRISLHARLTRHCQHVHYAPRAAFSSLPSEHLLFRFLTSESSLHDTSLQTGH